jgi:putative aldouronate transport system substrate-binding protein
MFKRKISAISASILVLAVFSGCNGGNGGIKSGIKGNDKAGYFKSDEPQKVIVSWMEAGKVVDGAETPVLKKAAELTNINIENILPKSTTDPDQAISLMMASKKLPDILHNNGRSKLLQYGRDGALIPLDELIDTYAPNFKKFINDNPDVRKTLLSTDGKIYYIPSIPDGEVSYAWFVRKDWVDKLGLRMPENTDEYYNVLKAFKERDPNGNGKADEIPYFSRAAGAGGYDFAVTCLYALWDSTKGFITRGDKIVFGPLEPQFKTAVKNIAKWYKEGLIDPEIFTRGSKARDVLFAQNTGGSTYDWISSTYQFNDSLQDKVPGFDIEAIAPPTGRIYDYRGTLKDVGWGITPSCQNPELAVRYMDFWFSETGRILANYGIDGDTYNMVDGKPVLTEKVLKAPDGKTALSVLNEYGAQFNMGYKQDFEYEKQWLNDGARAAMDMYINNKYVNPPNKSYTKTVEQSKRENELMGTVNTYLSEMQQQWILGTKDIDGTYDEFTARLKQMKIDEVVNINQEAYDAMLKLQ